MPHVILDFSAELENRYDMAALCDAIFDALAADEAIPNPAAIKVRAIPAPYARIGIAPHTYAHAMLHLMEGRSAELKKHLSQLVLDVMKTHMPDVGSLSVEPHDITAATYSIDVKG